MTRPLTIGRKSEAELEAIFLKIAHIAKKEDIFLSLATFARICKSVYGVSYHSQIQRRFATKTSGYSGNGFNVLKERLGIQAYKTNHTSEDLIKILHGIYLKNGEKQVTIADLEAEGKSVKLVQRLFGGIVSANKAMYEARNISLDIDESKSYKHQRMEKVGDSLSHYKIGLSEGPVNEQGVVVVFAKIHQLLGFPEIEKPQQQFPDCRATCTRRNGELFRANIEFKFRSARCYGKGRFAKEYVDKNINYLIVWENDSDRITREIGVEIISLKEELEKLYESGKIGGEEVG